MYPIAGSSLGAKQSEETKRKVGLASLNRGNRGVLNVTTGLIFKSIKEASDFYNINGSSIGEVCLGNRKTAGCYYWEFLEKEGYPRKPKLSKEAIEKLRVFNKGKKLSEEHIAKIKEGNKDRVYDNFPSFKGGKHTQEAKDKISKAVKARNEDEVFKARMAESHIKAVKNVTTGLIFKSIKEASEFYNISRTSIGQVCAGKRKTVGGYVWSWTEE